MRAKHPHEDKAASDTLWPLKGPALMHKLKHRHINKNNSLKRGVRAMVAIAFNSSTQEAEASRLL